MFFHKMTLPVVAMVLMLEMASACTDLDAHSSYQQLSFVGYDPNTDECYIIEASSSKKVEVYTDTLSTEGCFDYLELRCTNSNGERIGTYCNAEHVPNVVSGSNKMYVYFHSDSTTQGAGFNLYYRRVSGGSEDCSGANQIAASAMGIMAALCVAVSRLLS